MGSFTYLEESGDLSPQTATFGESSQSCSLPYVFSSPTFDNLRNAIVDILGYTDTRVSDGRVRRYLPARHPTYQWMYADSCSFQGVGSASTTTTTLQGVGSPLIAGSVPLYANYHVRVGFSPRNYNTWQDKDISVVAGTGYDKDDDGMVSGYAYTYAAEWMRFTEWLQYPANQYISAQQGQLVFRASGMSGAVQPNGFVFQDSPKMYLPDSVLKVRWYNVPYRYVLSNNSYLSRFVGYVNQIDFGPTVVGAGYGPYPKGSLLFLGATPVRIYTPAIPDEGLLAYNAGNGFLRNRLCDLELNFLYTARKIGTATGNTPDMSSVNRNWIVAGWNLLPWLTTRKFYYATMFDPANPATQASWYPMYRSLPFSLLFTDPDAATSPQIDP